MLILSNQNFENLHWHSYQSIQHAHGFSFVCIFWLLMTGSLNLVPGLYLAWPDEIGNEVDKSNSQPVSCIK